jgi:hypothetical protein
MRSGGSFCGLAIYASVALFAEGCSGQFQPSVEVWPGSDASTGIESPPAGDDAGGSSSSSSGGSSGSSGGGSGSSSGGSPGKPGGTVDAGKTQPRDAGTSGGGGADSGPGSAPGTPCSLAVTVTTLSDHGSYSPENVGAIWIATSSGTWVKTLKVWGTIRVGHLNAWNSATASAGFTNRTVDAITGATLSSFQTHMVTWNCTDDTRTAVPDGAYRVYFETADSNAAGPNSYVDFTKGAAAQTLSPSDATYFKSIKLVFTP